jgi:hypothetical protein
MIAKHLQMMKIINIQNGFLFKFNILNILILVRKLVIVEQKLELQNIEQFFVVMCLQLRDEEKCENYSGLIKKKLFSKLFFSTFGEIETVYQRTHLQMTDKLTKMMVSKKPELLERLNSTNFYIRFKSEENAEDAVKAMYF